MNVNVRVIKKQASNRLSGYIGTAILGMLAVFAVHGAGGWLGSMLFSGTDPLSLILYQVFLFIVSLIAAVFSAGLSYLYLNMARQKEASLGDLFFFFRRCPDRVIKASFVLSIVDLLVTIPYYYYGYTSTMGSTAQEQTRWLLTQFALLVLSLVLNQIITAPFAMAYYLLADDEDLDGFQALKQSTVLMQGSIKKLLLMKLSFVPAIFLSAFTLYLAMLWIAPHMQMSETVFYEKLLLARQESS